MNIVLFKQNEVINSIVTFSDYRFDHITTILKKEIGDYLKVGILNGKLGIGKIVEKDGTSISLKVELTDNPPAKLPVTLIVALPRPNTFKKILHTITVMGVKEVYFIKTNKVEKSFWSSPVLKESKVNNIILDGLMQAKDTIVPNIHFRKLFKPFIEDELPVICKNSNPIIFHPSDDGEKLKVDNSSEYVYLIGPEGGFTEYEVDKVTQVVSAKKVAMGERIMRVEQAIGTVLGYTSLSLL